MEITRDIAETAKNDLWKIRGGFSWGKYVSGLGLVHIDAETKKKLHPSYSDYEGMCILLIIDSRAPESVQFPQEHMSVPVARNYRTISLALISISVDRHCVISAFSFFKHIRLCVLLYF